MLSNCIFASSLLIGDLGSIVLSVYSSISLLVLILLLPFSFHWFSEHVVLQIFFRVLQVVVQRMKISFSCVWNTDKIESGSGKVFQCKRHNDRSQQSFNSSTSSNSSTCTKLYTSKDNKNGPITRQNDLIQIGMQITGRKINQVVGQGAQI